MIIKKVTRYYSECGRGFWKKQKALTHDINCKCWKNPKFKTCMSCKLRDIRTDSNGMHLHKQHLQIWQYNDCVHAEEGIPVHTDFDHIRKNCTMHEAV